MRLNDGSFSPPTEAEGRDHGEWESDIDRACGMTEHGRTFDPFLDTELLAEAIENLTGEQITEMAAAFHMGANETLGELLAQQFFKVAFAAAWRSLRPDEDTPDV